MVGTLGALAGADVVSRKVGKKYHEIPERTPAAPEVTEKTEGDVTITTF